MHIQEVIAAVEACPELQVMIYRNANGALLDLFAPTMNGPEVDLMGTRRHVAWVILGFIIWRKWRRRGEGEVPECHLAPHIPVLPCIMDNPLHHGEEDVTLDIMARASISIRVLGIKTKMKTTMMMMMMMMKMTGTKTGKRTIITPQTAFMTQTSSV